MVLSLTATLLDPWPLAALGRILLAALLGSTVGWERERHGRAAGLRTHMLLCLGCALIMLVSLHVPSLFAGQSAEGIVRADPGRIAGHALSGLGFLGAGAIIVLGARIRGLTTAAAIWVTAAIGLALGAGYLSPAIFAWALTMFALLAVGWLEGLMARKDRYIHLVCTFQGTSRRMDDLQQMLSDSGFTVLEATTDCEADRMRYALVLRYEKKMDFERITIGLREQLADRGLQRVEWHQ
ncbi:MAG: MgtC/SapB family protein [Candidatus Brocadiia bacterium]